MTGSTTEVFPPAPARFLSPELAHKPSEVLLQPALITSISPREEHLLFILELNTSVGGTLSLINGFLDTGNYFLDAGTFSGGSANSYVRTSGTGRLKMAVTAGETIFSPVGNTAYNPLSITNDEPTGTDVVNIRVSDESVANANDSI